MIITGSLLIVCVMLLLGVSVYVAFGSVSDLHRYGRGSVDPRVTCPPDRRGYAHWFFWRSHSS